MTPMSLVQKYPKALQDSDLMRGFKRSPTVYCKKRAAETGTPAERFRAAIKMLIRKAGYDPTPCG